MTDGPRLAIKGWSITLYKYLSILKGKYTQVLYPDIDWY